MLEKVKVKLEVLAELWCELNNFKYSDLYKVNTGYTDIYIRTTQDGWNKTFIHVQTGNIVRMEHVLYEGHAGMSQEWVLVGKAEFADLFVEKFKKYLDIKDQLESLQKVI